MKKFLTIAAIVVAAILAVLFIGVKIVSNFGRPVYSGKVEVKSEKLSDTVEIHYDEFAIPHIVGKTEEDVYFGLGYAHAQERLFQMQMFRLFSQGRLTEMSGDSPSDRKSSGFGSTLEQDMFYRTVGFKFMGEKGVGILDADTLALLESYTAGVNEYLANAKKLPPEFLIVGEPQEWKPADSLALGRLMAWFLSHNWDRELLRLQAMRELGPELGWEFLPKCTGRGPYIIDPKVKKYDPRGKKIEMRQEPPVSPEILGGETAAALLKIGSGGGVPGLFLTRAFGSNNWVVDGTRTKSGAPILSNDPHLMHLLPSIFYQAHLKSEDGLDVIGVTFAGMPIIALGHNRHVAWGATTTRADTQDLFVEKIDLSRPGEYLHEGEWKKFETREEVFRIKDDKGMREEKMTVRTTVHGPVLNDAVHAIPDNAPPIALAWTAYEETNDLKGFFEMARTKNAAGFKAAVMQVDVPVQNWVYADTGGNIGYWGGGLYPVRAKGDGTLPVPGWTGEYDWLGYVPDEELPQLDNPSSGTIFSANNPVLPEEDYPYTVSFNYQYLRAVRLAELLDSEEEKFTPDDMAGFQQDRYAYQGELLAPVFVEAYRNAGNPENEMAAKAVEILGGWDFVTSSDDPAPTIFYSAYRAAMELTLGDEVSEEVLASVMRVDATDVLYDRIFVEGDSPLFDKKDTEQVETRDEILAEAIETAAGRLAEKLGDDPAEWKWGKIHQMVFAHPMGFFWPLNAVFPVEIIPSDGSRGTVFLAHFTWAQDTFASTTGPCFRQVIDMSDIDGARMVIDTGQSGHPTSKHIFDQNDMWMNGDYVPMVMDIGKIGETGEGTLVLSPAGGKDK